MSLPAVPTLISSIRFVFANLKVLWWCFQVPLLLLILYCCVVFAVLSFTDPSSLIDVEITDGGAAQSQRPLYWILQISNNVIPYILLLPATVSWARYAAIGDAGLSDRKVWQFTKLELRYLGRSILLGIYMFFIMVGMSLAFALVYFTGRALGLDQTLGWLAIAAMIVLGIVAFCAVFVVALRWSAALLPCVFDSPLETGPAWKISKGVWKPLTLLGIITVVAFGVMMIPIIVFAPGPSDDVLAAQRGQVFGLIVGAVVGIIPGAIGWAIFSAYWRTPEGRAHWPETLPPLPAVEPA